MSHGRSGIDTTALDETGTLTQGRPEVTDLLPVSGTDPQELLRLDASLKTDSEHPARGGRGAAGAEGRARPAVVLP